MNRHGQFAVGFQCLRVGRRVLFHGAGQFLEAEAQRLGLLFGIQFVEKCFDPGCFLFCALDDPDRLGGSHLSFLHLEKQEAFKLSAA